MRLLLLALRNLSRNTRRTALTLAAISIGLSMMIWTVNFQNGSYGAMIDTAVSQMAGHVVIQAEGYQDDREPGVVVPNASDVVKALRTEYPDAVVAPRIFVGGLLMSPTNSVGASLSGMDPGAESQVQDIAEKVVEGEWFSEGADQVLIGDEMAKRLEVTIGDKLVYMGQVEGGEVDSKLFRVRGIFHSGAVELDGFVALVHLSAAQELIGGGDVANMITLHLKNADDAFAAVARIEQIIARPELDVRHWKDALPELFALIQLDRSSGDVMLAIIGLIVAFGVLNTLLMSVLERTREFGVMLAVGMKPKRLARLVLLEGLVLGLIGALLGLLLGLALSWPTVHYGIDMSAMTGGETMESGGIAIDMLVHGRWSFGRMTGYFCGAIVFCTLAAIYPAWTISKLRPVQALRHI